MSKREKISNVKKALMVQIKEQKDKLAASQSKKESAKLKKKINYSSDSDDTHDHELEEYSEKDDDEDISNGYVTPFGIKNIGNTCFMNSALQCLLSLTLFIEKIRGLISGAESSALIKEFLNFMKSHKPNKIKQLVAKKNKAFLGFAQQDSFEFTISLINAIAEENPKSVTNLFIGKSKTISLCTKCHKETKINEDFSSIILSVQEARRILYIPYSFKKHPVCMSDIPIVSSKIKVRESRTSKTTINKFILVTKISNEYKIIDKITPEYTDIYAFEIPNTTIEKGTGYILVQFKTTKGEPITFPFICPIPIKSISKDKVRTCIIERLKEVINTDLETIEIKHNMNITKPTFPPEFKLNDTKITKIPFCTNYITVEILDEDIFEIDNRTLQTEDKPIDLITLFDSHIQQKQLQAPCKWTCDKCGKKTRVFQRVKYTKFPKIVIFQIKRSTDLYMTHATPDNTEISFPQTILIKEDGSPTNYNEINTKFKDKPYKKYELRSISHHTGSFQGGHYWSHCKRGNKWYEFDDDEYGEIDETEEATGSSYVVFYQQVSDIKSTEAEEYEETETEEIDEDEDMIGSAKKENDEDNFEDDPGYIVPFGIKNIGNTCFMNSALQCFLSLSLLVEGIDDLISSSKFSVLLDDFRAFLIHHKPNKVKQLVAKKNKAFLGFAQQDSFEFVMTFINTIAEENPKGVTNLFIGKSKTISLCTKCHKETKINEDFSSIILSVQEARRILYIPYSFKKHPICMSDIPIVSSKIKVRESRTSKTTINKFILVTKISNEYKIIDKITPEYTDIYAFEIPNTTIEKGTGYIFVQFKTTKGEPITFPFICPIPIKSISKDKVRTCIIERLKEVINTDLETIEIKHNMNITKPTFPPEFKLNDTKITKIPFCTNYINVEILDEDIFEIDNRTLQTEDKAIDLITLFDSHIQQKQLQAPCKWTCDKCGKETRVFQRVKYTKFPKILIFQIKRSTDLYMTHATPDNTEISFPQTILIKEDGSPTNYNEINTKFKDKPYKKYELRSISHHTGSFQGGHYWANGKRGNKWYEFNDNHFEQIEEPTEATGSSYVIFYQQVVDDDDDDEDDEMKIDEDEEDEETDSY